MSFVGVENTHRVSPGHLRVLVAEDSEVNQRLIAAILQLRGIHPLIVSNGVAALAQVLLCRFDLIFLDISMPVMDGLTALRYIRELEKLERRQAAPIYIVSSQHEPEDLSASKAAGADGHLAKPIDVHRLHRVLEKTSALSRSGTQRPLTARGAN